MRHCQLRRVWRDVPWRERPGFVTLTDRGLASEAGTVNNIAHELSHLREAMPTGPPIIEEGRAIRLATWPSSSSGDMASSLLRRTAAEVREAFEGWLAARGGPLQKSDRFDSISTERMRANYFESSLT